MTLRGAHDGRRGDHAERERRRRTWQIPGQLQVRGLAVAETWPKTNSSRGLSTMTGAQPEQAHIGAARREREAVVPGRVEADAVDVRRWSEEAGPPGQAGHGRTAGGEQAPSNTRSRGRRWVPGRRCTGRREDEAGTVGVARVQELTILAGHAPVSTTIWQERADEARLEAEERERVAAVGGSRKLGLG
jgi:hypothetical protein